MGDRVSVEQWDSSLRTSLILLTPCPAEVSNLDWWDYFRLTIKREKILWRTGDTNERKWMNENETTHEHGHKSKNKNPHSKLLPWFSAFLAASLSLHGCINPSLMSSWYFCPRLARLDFLKGWTLESSRTSEWSHDSGLTFDPWPWSSVSVNIPIISSKLNTSRQNQTNLLQTSDLWYFSSDQWYFMKGLITHKVINRKIQTKSRKLITITITKHTTKQTYYNHKEKGYNIKLTITTRTKIQS